MTRWSAGGVSLPDGPVIIGVGACKHPEVTKDWLQIAPVVSGSYTQEPRSGKNGKVISPDGLEQLLTTGYGFNCYGMPNIGVVRAAAMFCKMSTRQPLIISVAGFSIDEYVKGVKIFGELPSVSAIELNFGCPNAQAEHPEIISFYPDVIRTVMHRVMQLGLAVPIWVKLSPYSNPQDLKHVAEVLNRFAGIGSMRIAVVTCNTFPSAYAGEQALSAPDGLAGLSGAALKPIALGQVRQFRKYLSPLIDVIGVGGVMNANDTLDFLQVGAKAVQVTSLAHWTGDPRTFNEYFFNGEVRPLLRICCFLTGGLHTP